MMVTQLMEFSWRKQTGKEAEFLFTVTVGMPCWGLGEHEYLIIALFLPIVSQRNWKGTWNIYGSDWGRGSVRDFEFWCQRKWNQPGPVPMEGNLRQVLEEGSERCGDIFRKLLCRVQAIPSMTEGVVRRLLR